MQLKNLLKIIKDIRNTYPIQSKVGNKSKNNKEIKVRDRQGI